MANVATGLLKSTATFTKLSAIPKFLRFRNFLVVVFYFTPFQSVQKSVLSEEIMNMLDPLCLFCDSLQIRTDDLRATFLEKLIKLVRPKNTEVFISRHTLFSHNLQESLDVCAFF